MAELGVIGVVKLMHHGSCHCGKVQFEFNGFSKSAACNRMRSTRR
jgi:hypothetical protein